MDCVEIVVAMPERCVHVGVLDIFGMDGDVHDPLFLAMQEGEEGNKSIGTI